MRRIGVLGGMGPAATVLFQQKLVASVAAEDDADHVPLLIDMNPQVPSRIAHLIDGTGPDPAPVLADMARRLERGGAEALAMPCNTAHAYADAIRGAVTIPLLDMVDVTAVRVRGRPGLLASPATLRTGLWQAVLPDMLWPDDPDALLPAIRAIKRGETAGPAATLAAAAEDLRGQGAQTLVIACTEFSLIAGAVPDALDTLDLLVAAARAFATGDAA